MGETYADARLRLNGRSILKRILVDTGATFSWIHEKDLRKLGVRPTDREKFETIEGKTARRDLGSVQIEVMGRTSPTVVVFARESDSEVLGLHALEGLRLEVDPVNRKLKRCTAVKALRQGSG